MKFYQFLCQFVKIRPRKTALDKPLYKLSAGRSMVEMLGVLAIIGVLSVGAISGYSKAMFKYKLNKHAESMNTLINNAIQLGPQLNRSFQQQAIGTIIFKQLNLIPEGMHYDEATNRIYDIFNNRISTSYYLEPVFKHVEYNIYISMNRVNNKISPYSAQICRNIVTVAKENAANIDSIQMRQKNEDGFNGTTALYGDSICTNPNNCLRNASLTDIDTLCNSCEAEVICEFYIFLPIK